jgi:hypothetical protein
MLFLHLQPKCLPAGNGIWVIERSFSQRDDPVSHSAPIVVAGSSSARIFNLEVPTRLFLTTLQYGTPSGYKELAIWLQVGLAGSWYILVPYGDIVFAPAKSDLEVMVLGN